MALGVEAARRPPNQELHTVMRGACGPEGEGVSGAVTCSGS